MIKVSLHYTLHITLTDHDEAAHFGEHDLALLYVVTLDHRDLGLPGHLPQPEVDAGVEHDQREQGDEAVDDEVHVDDVDFVIVAILTETRTHDDQILRRKCQQFEQFEPFYLKCLIGAIVCCGVFFYHCIRLRHVEKLDKRPFFSRQLKKFRDIVEQSEGCSWDDVVFSWPIVC